MFEDEEDLEALRLAALQSLQGQKKAKTETTPIQSTHSNYHNFNALPPANNGTFAPFSMNSPYQHNPSVLPFAPSLPYTPVGGHITLPTLPPIVPTLITNIDTVGCSTNVQLSPRSAAFVSQNNDILARRKQGKSPTYTRFPSPVGRYRRSISRSLSPNTTRRRSRSRGERYNRSPKRRRNSPYVTSKYRSTNTSPESWKVSSRSPHKRSQHRKSNSKSPKLRTFSRNFKNDRDRKRRVPERTKLKVEQKELDKNKSGSLSPAASLERILSNLDEKYNIDIEDRIVDNDNDDLIAKIDDVQTENSLSNQLTDDKSKAERDLEDELLASDDEVLNADIDDVDLFASEESESENEGRFKSGAKTERKTTTVIPFSKLTKTSSPDRLSTLPRKEETSKTSNKYQDNKPGNLRFHKFCPHSNFILKL